MGDGSDLELQAAALQLAAGLASAPALAAALGAAGMARCIPTILEALLAAVKAVLHPPDEAWRSPATWHSGCGRSVTFRRVEGNFRYDASKDVLLMQAGAGRHHAVPAVASRRPCSGGAVRSSRGAVRGPGAQSARPGWYV